MVCKEELCTWFRTLSPHRRIDFMCGLLHVCLPPELRFIGTVVEDLGKTNFQFLREAELKANSIPEVNRMRELGGHVQRSKIATSLALLHSSNTGCANILFTIIESVNLPLHISTSMSNQTVYEILMILTMALNHPAFSFDQKNKLYDLFQCCEDQASKLPKFQNDSEADLLLPHCKPISPVENCNFKQNKNNSGSSKSKVFVQNIDVQSCKKKDNKMEFKFQVIWSNGEVNEVHKTNQELEEFHLMLQKQRQELGHPLNSHRVAPFPSYPGISQSNKEDILEEFKKYTRLLLCNVFPLLRRRDQVTDFFQNNTGVQESETLDRVKPPTPPISPSVTSFVENKIKSNRSDLPNHLPMMNRYQCPPCSRMTPPLLPGHSPLSSPNNSPHNSRSASPNTQNFDYSSLRHHVHLQKPSDGLRFIEKKIQYMTTDETNMHGNLKDTSNKKPNLTRERCNHVPSNGIYDMMNSKIGDTPVISAWPPPPPLFSPYLHAPPPASYRTESYLPPYFQSYPSVNSPGTNDSGSEYASLPPSPVPSATRFQKNSDSSSDDNEKVERKDSDKASPEDVSASVGQHLLNQAKVVDSSATQYLDTKPDIQILPSLTAHRENMVDASSCSDINSAFINGFPPRPMVPVRAQPAHTNIIHASVINMPPENFIGKASLPVLNGAPCDIPVSPVSVPMGQQNSALYNENTGNAGIRPQVHYMPASNTRDTVENGSVLLRTMCNMNTSTSVTCSSSPTVNVQTGVNCDCSKNISHVTDVPENSQSSLGDQPSPLKIDPTKQGNQSISPNNVTHTSQQNSLAKHTCNSCGCKGLDMPYQMLVNPFSAPYCYFPVRLPVSSSNGVIPQPTYGLPYGHHLPNIKLPNGTNSDALYGNHPNFGLLQSHQHYMHLNMLYGMPPYNWLANQDTVKQKPPSCYNCGSNSHKAVECRENSMASLSAHYHLNYKPKSKSDSE